MLLFNDIHLSVTIWRPTVPEPRSLVRHAGLTYARDPPGAAETADKKPHEVLDTREESETQLHGTFDKGEDVFT